MTFRTVIPVLLVLGSFGNPVQANERPDPVRVVDQCMASVEVVDNFEEYRAELQICYNNNGNY